jgi:hypothetical protein
MGAANPIAAAKKTVEIAQKLGLNLKIAALTGDDVLEKIDPSTPALENQRPIAAAGEIISANAYLGIEGILEALTSGAQIIITGRVADPSLFLAPMIHEFGWSVEDYDLLGKGTAIGHLLECAGQLTGGYYADPVKKPVAGLEQLGHPFADVFPDGSAILSKVKGTGGILNLQTAKEQLLYEVVNPYEYLTPDVKADFTTINLQAIGEDEVKVTGGTGKKKTETYKVSVGYKAFYLGEGEISYAGASALERATLAGDILAKRLQGQVDDLRVDLIGVNSVHRTTFQTPITPPYEIRLRVAGKSAHLANAALVGEEVEALYTNGPAGGGGVRKYINEVVGIVSILLDRTTITPTVTLFES